MTHSEIVEKAAKWLKKHKENIIIPNCRLVLTELKCSSHSGEIPDIIGWSSTYSVLIEVKISKADFRRDAKKLYRRWSNGMGQFIYYLVPEGLLIKDSWIYPKCGLLTINDKGKILIVKKAEKRNEADLISERSLLLSYIRRNQL